jgi:hypothetical protein
VVFETKVQLAQFDRMFAQFPQLFEVVFKNYPAPHTVVFVVLLVVFV